MIELFLKLIDKCISLVKARQEQDKGFYTDFVAPAFADFEMLHKDYLDSFRRYRDVIETTNLPLNAEHSIFEMVRNDSLFSDNLRSKLREMYGQFARSGLPEMNIFMYSVLRYLTYIVNITGRLHSSVRAITQTEKVKLLADLDAASISKDSPEESIRFSPAEADGRANFPRWFFTIGLKDIVEANLPEQEKRKSALQLVSQNVRLIQYNYRRVIHAHAQLKKRLLQTRKIVLPQVETNNYE